MQTMARILFLGFLTLAQFVMADDGGVKIPSKSVENIEAKLLRSRDPLDSFKISYAFKNLENAKLAYGASRIDYEHNPKYVVTIFLHVVDDKTFKAEVSVNVNDEGALLKNITYNLKNRTLLVGPVSKRLTAVFESTSDVELGDTLVEVMAQFSRGFY